jgi:hypothetical protein
MRKVLFLAALLLSACAQSERLTDAQGNVGFDLACFAHTDPGCDREAKKLCGGDYEVIDEYPDHGPLGITYERKVLCRKTPPAPTPPPAAAATPVTPPAPMPPPKLPFRQ